MKKSYLLGAMCTCLICLVPLSAHAVAVSGQGTWETTLQGRDLDGDLSTIEAYYDTILNITWLADANAGAGSVFDDGGLTTDGRVTWSSASAWTASLTLGGVTSWRLPTVQPSSCTNTVNGYDYNCSGIEMGHMFYNVLGNTAQYSPTGVLQPDYGLSNTGPFINLMAESYWSATEYNTDTAYRLYFENGGLDETLKSFSFPIAWAVHDGDVGTAIVTVNIDIKPDRLSENVISLKKDKNLKVAIVGDSDFDALQVDPATVRFGPSEASPVRFKGQDYNRDGFSDLILTFKLNETGIDCTVDSATLTGQTVPDPVTNITGSDSFTVEPCP